ncbi:MAG TPA: M48 family metallopeptidase [Verrucomicrobiae bacterium]|nr:M48 family metallopeptidase [Verrucomicrobiae bacterium]
MVEPGESLQRNNYPGGAFDPSLEGGSASGTITLSETLVNFESGKGTVSLPADAMNVEVGGVSGEVVFFKHPARPQTVIHTRERAILAHPLLANRSDLATQNRNDRRRRRTLLTVALTIALLFVATIVVLIASKDRIVSGIADSIPVEWEVKFGDQAFASLISGKREITDPAIQQQLKLITAPLLEGVKDAPYSFRFHIIEDPTLNAFAVPGGHVVIHTGLLLASDAPEEVAGVLAHEIAHVTRRHGFRNVISTLGLYQLVQLVVGDASGIIAVLASNSTFLLERKFSRDFEREADDAGWDYLMHANIRPDGMIEFFRKMRKEETKAAGADSGAMALMSTHPATAERIANLESRWRNVETKSGFHAFPINYREFKEQVQNAVRK